jgi:hypothetical protein
LNCLIELPVLGPRPEAYIESCPCSRQKRKACEIVPRSAEGVPVKPRIGPGSLQDKTTRLNDAFIKIEISYLDSPSSYRETVRAQTPTQTNSSCQRARSQKRFKKNWKTISRWALIGFGLFAAILTWLAR